MIRKCEKCGFEFDERDLEFSHDIPKYLGGKDSDGRHYLCKECHRDYEMRVALLVIKEFLPKAVFIRKRVKDYAKWYFKEENK